MRISERVRADLAATTRFGDIRLLGEVDSTNRYVRDAVLAGAAEGLVVVADHQTAGRGRLDRTWEALPATGLLVSILLRPTDLAADRLHLVTAAAGLAAVDACRRAAGFEPALKWPNDLLVGDRKLAGILAESVAGAVVVGLGLNVSAAPPGAVSVAEVVGRAVPRRDLLVALLEAIEARYGRWDAVAAEYQRACATVGRRVRVEEPGGQVRTGLALSVGTDGRLVVHFDGGRIEPVRAGDVVHLRAVDEDP